MTETSSVDEAFAEVIPDEGQPNPDGQTPPSDDPAPQAPEPGEPADEPKAETPDAKETKDGGDKPDTPQDDDPYASVRLPDDALLPPEALDEIKALGRELQLTPEAVSAFAERDEKRIRAYEEARQAQVAGWKRTLREHPTLGGDNFKRTNLRVETALKADPELRALLDEPSADNPGGTSFKYHPVVAAHLESLGASSMEPRKVAQGGVPASPEGDSPSDIFNHPDSAYLRDD